MGAYDRRGSECSASEGEGIRRVTTEERQADQTCLHPARHCVDLARILLGTRRGGDTDSARRRRRIKGRSDAYENVSSETSVQMNFKVVRGRTASLVDGLVRRDVELPVLCGS